MSKLLEEEPGTREIYYIVVKTIDGKIQSELSITERHRKFYSFPEAILTYDKERRTYDEVSLFKVDETLMARSFTTNKIKENKDA